MSKIGDWWKKHFLFAELLLSLALGIGFTIWATRFHGSTAINQTMAGNRGLIYTATATIAASLFGFVITAISIVLGFTGSSRLDNVRKSVHFKDLWTIFTSAIRALSCATICALAGLVFDRDALSSHLTSSNASHPHLTLGQLILYMCVFTGLLSVLRLWRCVWVLEQLILLITKQSPARSGE